MARIAIKILLGQRSHFLVTIGGVAVVTMMMVLLFGIYEGAREGSTGYILESPADLWVCQNNSTNILRSSSFLQSSMQEEIGAIGGVDSTTSILRVLTTARIRDRVVTLFLFGIDPASTMAMPPMANGSQGTIEDGELIVDRSFAIKHDLTIGDTVTIQGRKFTIRAMCVRTNAVLAQLTFCSLRDAQTLLGYPGLASFFLVRLGREADPGTVLAEIQRRVPGTSAFLKEEFVANTIREMETGVIPILWAIAVLGIVVGAVVVTLLLYGSVVDRRQDYALLKAVGSGRWSLFSLVLWQAVIVAGLGDLLGLGTAAFLTPALSVLVPEISPVITWQFVGVAGGANLVIACAGAAAPLRKLAGIDPEEVFRT